MTSDSYEKPKSAEIGAHIYSPQLLRIYDVFILGFISSFAWCCSTKKILVPFFREPIGKNHIDIGVGTGYYLVNAGIPQSTKVTLVDLNENSLEVTKARFGRDDVTLLKHDIFQPLPTSEKFDSMSLFYLFHCLPGPVSRKTAIFSHLKHNLTTDGILYGSTILGTGVRYNTFARSVMWTCNTKGIFDNWKDNREEIVRALEQHFDKVESQVVGTILMFSGRGPKI